MSCFGPGEAGVEALQASSGFHVPAITSSSQQMPSCCPSGSEALPLLQRPGWGGKRVAWGGGHSPSSWWPLDPHAGGLLSCTLQGASPCSPALFIFVQHS